MDKNVYCIKINNTKAKNLNKVSTIVYFIFNTVLCSFSNVVENAASLLHSNFVPGGSVPETERECVPEISFHDGPHWKVHSIQAWRVC